MFFQRTSSSKMIPIFHCCWIFIWIHIINVTYCLKIIPTTTTASSSSFTTATINNNPCLNPENFCDNGGSCLVANDSASSNVICICTAGFTGEKCETKNLGSCSNKICNGGACIPNETSIQCLCPPGYTGHFCEVTLEENCLVPCPDDSICHNSQCECPLGSIGVPGSCRSDPCSSGPCLNGATCVTDANFIRYSCVCANGYSGNFCQIRPLAEAFGGPCKKVQCPAGQKCISRGEIVSCVPTDLDATPHNNAHLKPLHVVVPTTTTAAATPSNKINLSVSQFVETRLVPTFPLLQPGLQCPPQTCVNGGTCFNGSSGLYCQCRPGYTGLHCENDVDECALYDPCQHGVCQNHDGSYQCWCRPGYLGTNCTDDFDECYSNPCNNGGTCVNTMGSYECQCTTRFTGLHCEKPTHSQILLHPKPAVPSVTQPDNCLNKTCSNGGTCVDSLVGYQCMCLPGYSGLHCGTIVAKDPCSPNPCPTGQCMRMPTDLSKYTCLCDADDVGGSHCDSPVELCSKVDCLNNGSCDSETGLCKCSTGYSGKTCEIEVTQQQQVKCNINFCKNGGVCKEHNTPTGPNIECICAEGYEGVNCEIPLMHTTKIMQKLCSTNGTVQCENGATCRETTSGSVTCLCPVGYTGKKCEIDVDECFLSPKLCGPNSQQCINVPGSFKCICKEFYGGPLCNISLQGCSEVTCKAGYLCKPSIDAGGHYGHICKCPDGFTGENCLEDTTVSFSGNSLMAYVTPNSIPNNYTLRFRFRTTVLNSVVVSGDSIFGNIFIIYMKNGQIHCSWKDQELFLRTKCNDGFWHEVQMKLNNSYSTTSLIKNDVLLETQSLLLSQSFQSIFTTKFGGPPMPQIGKDYSGCMQNIVVDGRHVIPKQLQQSSLNVQAGCTRQEQCKQGSCSTNGRCVDLWSSYECECKRPYLPPKCDFALPEVTFGYGSNRSYADIQMTQIEKQALTQNIDISVLVRTRHSDGALVYIGSEANENSPSDVFLAVQISNGYLKCTAKLSQNLPLTLTSGPLINDGRIHLIRVTRNGGSIIGHVDGQQVFNGNIPGRFVYPLFADYFLLGGYPLIIPATSQQTSNRFKRSTNPQISPEAFTNTKTFKGTIQDPRVNDMLILFTSESQKTTGVEIFGTTKLMNNVLQGTVSDDTCVEKPCLNNGLCTVTFNDFNCSCSTGWRGKTCSQKDYCLKNPCPKEAECKNLEPDGFACLSDVTFDKSSFAHFSLMNPNSSDVFRTLSFEMRTRDKNGIILFVTGDESDSLFSVELIDGGLNVAFVLETGVSAQVVQSANVTGNYPLNDGEWHHLKLTFEKDQSFLEIDNETNVFYLDGSAPLPLSNLFLKPTSKLFLGLLPPTFAQLVGGSVQSFKGCLSNVMFGIPSDYHSAFPLSFYKISNGTTTSFLNQHFELNDMKNVSNDCHGDPVCNQRCKNGANCVDLFNKFRCDCSIGFKGAVCEVNIDDCELNQCQNNASCIDGIANYTCSCSPGTTGRFCEVDIDECASAPCLNHGTCTDLRNGYQCTCNEDYTGKHCEFSLLVDCNSNPCLNNGHCSDVKLGTKKSFNCSCHPSYYGQFCENEVNFCERTPCHANGTCVSHAATQDVSCTCPIGYTGKLCETDIDDCQPRPCIHGTCKDGIANFTCQCSKGWHGFLCNDDVDECLSSPCASRATCVNNLGNFTCVCPKYYLGEFCEIEGGCLKQPCTKGECEQLSATSLRCLCPVGYTGQFCETEINYCDSKPCLNEATCSRLIGGYTCHCKPGFTGVNCETNINECDSSPCHNHGKCVDDINKFICACNGTGYSGDLCQHDIDECTLGGFCFEGTCRNLFGNYNCSCNAGYIGRKCNFKDPCLSANVTLKCKNGGKCHNPQVIESEGKIDYDCSCPSTFAGDLCETPKQALGSEGPPLVYIIAPIVGFVLLVCLISCITFLMVARKKRATRGTYSPSRQELSGARVQMGAMMKPPPEERLI